MKLNHSVVLEQGKNTVCGDKSKKVRKFLYI